MANLKEKVWVGFRLKKGLFAQEAFVLCSEGNRGRSFRYEEELVPMSWGRMEQS